jgi:hypothetical protein
MVQAYDPPNSSQNGLPLSGRKLRCLVGGISDSSHHIHKQVGRIAPVLLNLVEGDGKGFTLFCLGEAALFGKRPFAE